MATASTMNRYFNKWLGTTARSEYDVVSLVEDGLPLHALEQMIRNGLAKDEIYRIVIPARTLKHRRSRRQHLSKEESDRAIRTARLLARAQAVFGTVESGLSWMRAPKRRFESQSPLEMMRSEAGSRLVEEMLIQIEEGMFA